VIFSTPSGATKAVKSLKGVRIDDRNLKVEIIGEAAAVVEPKKLSERASQPKNATKDKPKPATEAKGVKAGAGKKGPRARGGGRAGRAARPKKSADQLDQEMADYWDGGNAGGNAAAAAAGNAATAGGPVQPTANTDMVDGDIQ